MSRRTATPSRDLPVSVVMATYNGEAFLGQQLASLASQTLRPYELVVADDCSSDGTVRVVERFAERAPFPVRIVRNPKNIGYGENFLQACAMAAGEVIALCDQDDVWRKDKLRIAVDTMIASGADLYVHGAQVVGSSGEIGRRFRQGILRRQVVGPLRLRPWRVFYGFSMVFNRELLATMEPSRRGAHTFEHDTPLSHDLWVYFLAQSLFTTALDPRALVRYRQHHGNVTPHVIGGGTRRLTAALGRAVDPGLSRARIAADRSRELEDLAVNVTQQELATSSQLGARYWARVAVIERRRIVLYRSRPWSVRLRVWVRLVVGGAYSIIGPGLVLKDLIAGVSRIRRRPR